jgi:ferredoxin
MYRISIDRSLCNGHGVCEAIAPEVFELGDDGLAVLRTAMSEDAAVQEACDSCPMGAISAARVEAA